VTEESGQHEHSYHPFDQREFCGRFLPAIQGEEPIVRELLDAANASGPKWTALHNMFDETRKTFLEAVETDDGGAAQRTIFPAFCRLLSHLRPVYLVKGFSFSSIDRREFPELMAFVKSPGELMLDDGGNPLPGITALMPTRVPNKCLSGRSGGGVVLKDDVRPMIDQLRIDMPRLAKWADERGLPAEGGLTIMLAALVRAKLKGCALIEGSNVLEGDTHLDKSHRLSYETPTALAPAVVREVGKVFGRTPPPAKAPEPEPEPEPEQAVKYTPQGTYEIGQLLQHARFGSGEVIEILDSRHLTVQFADQAKTLIQGLVRAQASDDDDDESDVDAGSGEEQAEPEQAGSL
jgi:hypothetical protein